MSFEPEQFMHVTLTERSSTEFPVIPEGTYTCLLGEAKLSKNLSKKTGDEFLSVDIECEIDDERVREAVGRDKVTSRLGFIVDLDEHNGSMVIAEGEGVNVRLGWLREAIGLNEKEFNFGMVGGQVVMGQLKNKAGEGGQVFSNIVRVAKPE